MPGAFLSSDQKCCNKSRHAAPMWNKKLNGFCTVSLVTLEHFVLLTNVKYCPVEENMADMLDLMKLSYHAMPNYSRKIKIYPSFLSLWSVCLRIWKIVKLHVIYADISSSSKSSYSFTSQHIWTYNQHLFLKSTTLGDILAWQQGSLLKFNKIQFISHVKH